MNKLKARVILSMIIVPLGLIIAAIPENTTKQYKLDSQQLLNEMVEGNQFIVPDEVAHMLVQKDPSLQLIDVRSADEFDKFHLPGAINIPLNSILAEEWEDYVNQDVKMNVFYSNGVTKGNEAWMLTRKLGYENNYVLQGGLNYWAETIMNPEAPKNTVADDELAKYNFRMAAGNALGGGKLQTSNTSTNTKKKKPIIKKRPKKKRAAGGC